MVLLFPKHATLEHKGFLLGFKGCVPRALTPDSPSQALKRQNAGFAVLLPPERVPVSLRVGSFLAVFFAFFARGVAKVPKHAGDRYGKPKKIAFWRSVGVDFSKSCFKRSFPWSLFRKG